MAGSGLKWTPEQLAAWQERQARMRGIAHRPTGQVVTNVASDKRSVPEDSRTVEPKRSKHGNVKTVIDGVRFDSKHEAAVWQQLVERERAGEIQQLVRQVRFPLVVNDIEVCAYVADFAWKEGERRVVADAKSEHTRKLPEYRIKAKLMRAVHGIEVAEL